MKGDDIKIKIKGNKIRHSMQCVVKRGKSKRPSSKKGMINIERREEIDSAKEGEICL